MGQVLLSHVVRLFVKKYPEYTIVNLDKLTYAGSLNLMDIKESSNYIFEKGDIVNQEYIIKLFQKYNFNGVIHLAAESHVDRSITNPTQLLKQMLLVLSTYLMPLKIYGKIILIINYFTIFLQMKSMEVLESLVYF